MSAPASASVAARPTIVIPEAEPERTRSHLRFRDLISEATAGLLARPGRLALTALGTVLGIAALVSTLGVAETAGSQIVGAFDALAATKVTVRPDRPNFGFGSQSESTIPWDAEARMTRINGVVAAGTKSDVNIGSDLARAVPVVDPLNPSEFSIPVIAASPGLFDAVRTTMRTGRTFDEGHNGRADNVAIIGPTAAARLNVTRVDNTPAIFIGERPFLLMGIIDNVVREQDLMNAIIIPDRTAEDLYGMTAPAEVHIDTEIGAAQQVAEVAAATLDPVDPSRLRASTLPSVTAPREQARDDVTALFYTLGGISLLVGALGIANVTLVSVLERRSEIGLRRALGAERRHIALQFLLESTATGLLGGIIGASLGMIVVVGVSANQGWTPVLDGRLPFVATLAGAVIGLLAGTYPSWRAARIEPIAALRGTE